MTIADCLEYQWVTCFQESAEFILGQNAAFLGELKEKVSHLAYCIFSKCLEVELCFIHLVVALPSNFLLFLILLVRKYSCNVGFEGNLEKDVRYVWNTSADPSESMISSPCVHV